MSRGPGRLGREILRELHETPGRRLAWGELKRRFPAAVRNKSFYRAVRSLRRAGRILDAEIGSERQIGLAPVYESGGRPRLAYTEDRQLAALVGEAHRLLAVVSRAYGVPVPPLSPSTVHYLEELENVTRPDSTVLGA